MINSLLNMGLCALLLLMALTGFSQTHTTYFTGNSSDKITNPKGGICLMGGATENDEAMKWFLRRADGGDVLVLRASGSDGYNDYFFSELGVSINSVKTIVFLQPSAATDAEVLQSIQTAEAIWFAGGDQWKYVSYWRNSPVDSLINKAIEDRNIVIGGTSAGMAIQGGFYFSAQNGTITSVNALSDPFDSRLTVESAPFLKNEILKEVITDTHYDDPDRRGRHAAFLARIYTDHGIAARGIACEEYTAVCIDEQGLARVYGGFPDYDDKAFFIQVNCELSEEGPEACQPGQVLTWNRGGAALKVYKVPGTNAGSNSFDLIDWKTGVGGSFEHWSIENGNFRAIAGTAPDCTTATEEVEAKPEAIELFPNPCKDTVQLRSSRRIILGVEIFDAEGRRLLTRKDLRAQVIQLPTQELQPGLYSLRIQTNEGEVIKKLLKME